MAKPKKNSKKLVYGLKPLSRKNKFFVILLVCFAVFAAIVGGFLLYYVRIYSDPQRTFWSMIDNNLSTSGITRQTQQKNGLAVTNDTTQLIFVPTTYAAYQKKIKDTSPQQSASLTLNGIGIPKTDYNNYSYIDRPGKKGDYAKVYKMWLKSDQPQILGNSIFNGVFFGNMTPPQRQAIEKVLKDAYKINSSKLNSPGRNSIDFGVTLNMQKYALAAVAYVKATGLPNADQISPNSYPANAKIDMNISVDVLSRQIKKIEYPNSKVTDYYSGYGISKSPNLPSKTVGLEEFQNILNSVVK
jgi:hypothetical protein